MGLPREWFHDSDVLSHGSRKDVLESTNTESCRASFAVSLIATPHGVVVSIYSIVQNMIRS